jgi:hypothetical protein
MKFVLVSPSSLRRSALGFGGAILAFVLQVEADPSDGVVRDDRVGVCTHFGQGWNVSEIMPMVADLGVGWIRDDQSWGEMEPQPGHYVIPARLSEWVNAAHAEHLKVLVVLGYGNKAYPDPFSAPAYGQAAAFLATHMKGKINAIEVLNEPNNPDFYPVYSGKWNGNEDDGSVSPYVRAYVNVLTAAVAAVKKADPAMLVVGYGAPPPATFRMIALGGPAGLDGITDHSYSGAARLPELIPYPANPGILKRDGIATADLLGTYASQCALFRSWEERHGLDAALWNTEWGFSTTQSAAHPEQDLSPDAQAAYVIRRLLEARALDVQSFYYVFKDEGGDPTQEFQNFGLVDGQLRKKPAFFAFRRFTQAFAHLTGNGTCEGFSLGAEAVAPGGLGNRCYGYEGPAGTGKWVACWKVEAWPAANPLQRGRLVLPAGNTWAHAIQVDFLSGEARPIPLLADGNGRQYLSVVLDANPCVVHLFN